MPRTQSSNRGSKSQSNRSREGARMASSSNRGARSKSASRSQGRSTNGRAGARSGMALMDSEERRANAQRDDVERDVMESLKSDDEEERGGTRQQSRNARSASRRRAA